MKKYNKWIFNVASGLALCTLQIYTPHFYVI